MRSAKRQESLVLRFTYRKELKRSRHYIVFLQAVRASMLTGKVGASCLGKGQGETQKEAQGLEAHRVVVGHL